MDNSLKQRLLGAALLVALAVIFIPMLFDGADRQEPVALDMEMPPEPEYTFQEPAKEMPLTKQARENKAKPGRAGRSGEIARINQAAKAPTANAPRSDEAGPAPITEPAPDRASKPAQTASQAPAPEAPAASAPKSIEEATADTAPGDSPAQVTTMDSPAETSQAASPPAAPPAEVAKPAAPTPPTPAQATASPDTAPTAWAVQVGSFTEHENATSLRDELRDSGFAAFEERIVAEGEEVYRVKVGPEFNRERAEDLQARLRSQENLQGIVVTYPSASNGEVVRGGG